MRHKLTLILRGCSLVSSAGRNPLVRFSSRALVGPGFSFYGNNAPPPTQRTQKKKAAPAATAEACTVSMNFIHLMYAVAHMPECSKCGRFRPLPYAPAD